MIQSYKQNQNPVPEATFETKPTHYKPIIISISHPSNFVCVFFRGFTMRQSSKRVYPLHEVDQGTDMDVDNRHALWRQPELADMKEISPRYT